MLARFICLANSFKEGGRCLAGIELDESNNPVFINGRAKWIRPVFDTKNGEIPALLVNHISLLDIVEIEVTGTKISHYQTENVLFNEDSLYIKGIYDSGNLSILCDKRKLIFGNAGKAIAEEKIANLDYSIILISTNQLEVIENTFKENPNKRQTRLVFTYDNNLYNFPVTDPEFIDKYQNNPDFFEQFNEAFLTVSLGIPWNDWYYKIVAGIIF